MTFMMKMGLCALMAVMSSGAVAKEVSPPEPGSVCAESIATYVEQAGAVKFGVVRISSSTRGNERLKFVAQTDEGLVPGLKVDELPPLAGGPTYLTFLQVWARSNGMWLVMTPGTSGLHRAQVFVSGYNRGEPSCAPLYRAPVDFEVAAAPEDILQ